MSATEFNQKTIDEFNARRGRGIAPWGDNLLLMTSLAPSGREVTTPLVYRRRGGKEYVVIGSKGGAPDAPKWLRSITLQPEVRAEVAAGEGTETFRARARIVADGPERDALYAYMVEVWPAFADYEKKTTRLIPAVILERLD